MRASDLMTGGPAACRPGDPATECLKAMDRRACGAVPVIDDDHRVIGIVTDRDLLFAIRANGGTLDGLQVRACMTDHPVTVVQGDDAAEVVRRMREARVRRAPVVDGDGTLVGMVAQADLATRLDDDRALVDFLRTVSSAPAIEPAPVR